ncbi:hypothetical protein ACF3DV_28450 [Chlorogloeopsis fritschii PCC 9212]|uniref:Alginate lyase domain-containing protein n=1 Tax=Chlorogloeopsis fritschii PCC 6912 TaxID=211165 RepID=A0A433N3G3_CHLFR|nr:hypothetical protein [Chlorogloeopsis fritschii]RUR75739.1 hypothetical protein PCC6912_46360 [Chlorogloeopsis fritschii PCC 6912]
MEADFQQRSKDVIAKLADSKYGTTAFESEKKSYPKAMIDFLAGNRARAIAFLQSEDADAQNHAHTLGIDFYSGFTLKGQVRKYFYFGKYLNPAYRQRMKKAMQIWTEVDPLTRHFPYQRQFWQKSTDNCDTWVDCRNTDNLKAMREVAVYLFAEESGNEQTRKIYKERISHNVRTLYQIGQGEWDSENYLGHTITSYINLYDFALDPEVKSLAKSALDWFFASGALKYWRGGFGGPSKRDYSQGNCSWCSLATHSLGLYFGDSPLADPKPEPDEIHLITSSYRPPAAVVALARKQFQKPVELLNSKPTYENWKLGGDDAPQFYETLYFGNTFQLGTLAQGSGGDWNGFKLMAFNTERGVDYFIAATGTDPTKISTSSVGGDNVAQYRNLVIWLNNKPQVPFQFFLPKSAKLETDNGVTFIRYEKTWLALTPINLKVEGINHKATQKMSDRYPIDQILTATGTLKTISGFALEVGERESYGSWQQFKLSVLEKSRLNLSQIHGGIVEYRGVAGNIKLKYQDSGLPKVWRNGQAHDWKNHFAVYQNPDGGKTPIYLGWKEGKLSVDAGGYNFQTQP